MGVLEFFGTLLRNDITASSIMSDYKNKLPVNHLLMDFNSIVHVASQKIISDVNSFMQNVLTNLYQNRSLNTTLLNEQFTKYKMQHIQKRINNNTDPIEITKLFNNHFDDKFMDRLIITLVISVLLSIIRTYCTNETMKTLLIAIDGVPSKGKMIEQKQR
ncbi:unknown [Acanthamoeba polyphaga mimivirus]|uniref:Uncharacterized protein R527 n=1 Tax=Acanthamoeba polyphaga mimivirus TaxID=212035 RepID=YR527_MIMIV|nr:RecName: Full=Uncharacterized protein R527 [Acanthamoeba polyphaga mimivirus]AAV50791.1 unknown [Acanthamoeba polyphaga mimivirus]